MNKELEAGSLIVVLPELDLKPLPLPVNAVSAHGLRRSHKVRAFLEHLVRLQEPECVWAKLSGLGELIGMRPNLSSLYVIVTLCRTAS